MASLTKKIVRGRPYYYARECQRIDGKPTIIWQKYLGRLEDIVAAVDQVRQGTTPIPQPERQTQLSELGAAAALYDLSQQLDLVATINRHVPKRGPGPSVGTYLLAAVLNRCLAPRSKAQLGAWFGTTVLRRLLPIESRQLTSQRFWDNMDRVSAPAIDAIEADLLQRVVTTFQLDVRRLLLDATNYFTYIDSFNDASTLAQRGHSKEGRAALRLVGLALVVTADGQVPLLHHTYPGNQADATTFTSLTPVLLGRLQQLTQQVSHVTLVFDKGNNSQANLALLDRSPLHFVGALVPTQHPELLAIPRDAFVSLADEGLAGVTAHRTTQNILGQQRTVVVSYNERLFVAQAKTLLREIARRQRSLGDVAARLERWRQGTVRGGRPPTLEGTQQAVDSILRGRHMHDLFAAEVQLQGNLPQLTYGFRAEAWEALQRTLLGKTLLFTDQHEWSAAQIVQAYRGQHGIEQAFHTLKDPQHIALRPQYHWTDQKVRVHVFVCVLALLLLSLLRRQAAARGFDLSLGRLLELLGGIREVVTVFPPAAGDTDPRLRTSLTAMSAEQRALFEAFALGRHTAA
jgi:transposase